jgi:hypothetical protein
VNDPVVRSYRIRLCDLCIAGAGGECHVPGCAMFLNRAPDVPLTPMPGGTIEIVDEVAL